jgi:hypothetical protein
MPRYAPQSLPMGGSRPQAVQETDDIEQQHSTEDDMAIHPAVSLGQHIRRERGMEGVRGYVVALREYLPPLEYQEVCKAMGVPADLQPQQRQAPVQQQQPAQEAPQPQNNTNNQMQMLQMLQMLMAMQNGGMGGMSGQNAMGNSTGGGINPMMLAQLAGMNGMGGMGGQGGGINPMMLAQLLGGMQK